MKVSVILPITFVIIVWGITSTVEAVSLRSFSPIEFTFYCTLFGMTGAKLISVAAKRNKTPAVVSYFYGKTFLLAMIGFAGYFLLKFSAYVYSPIPQANVIQYSFTIFIVLLAKPLLGQKLGVSKIAGVLIGFAGVAIVMSDAIRGTAISVEYLPGYLLALAAGISFALFSVLIEKWKLDLIRSLVYLHGFSAAVLGIILLAGNGIPVPESPSEIFGAFYSGFISNCLGIYFWLLAQSKTEDVSLLTGTLYFIPFISLISLRIFLGLPVPESTAIGLVLITAGMLIHILRKRFSRPII